MSFIVLPLMPNITHLDTFLYHTKITYKIFQQDGVCQRACQISLQSFCCFCCSQGTCACAFLLLWFKTLNYSKGRGETYTQIQHKINDMFHTPCACTKCLVVRGY